MCYWSLWLPVRYYCSLKRGATLFSAKAQQCLVATTLEAKATLTSKRLRLGSECFSDVRPCSTQRQNLRARGIRKDQCLSMTCCKTYCLTSLLTLTIFTLLFINSCCYCFCFCYPHFVCSCPIDPFTNLKFSSNYKLGLIFMEPPCET